MIHLFLSDTRSRKKERTYVFRHSCIPALKHTCAKGEREGAYHLATGTFFYFHHHYTLTLLLRLYVIPDISPILRNLHLYYVPIFHSSLSMYKVKSNLRSTQCPLPRMYTEIVRTEQRLCDQFPVTISFFLVFPF